MQLFSLRGPFDQGSVIRSLAGAAMVYTLAAYLSLFFAIVGFWVIKVGWSMLWGTQNFRFLWPVVLITLGILLGWLGVSAIAACRNDLRATMDEVRDKRPPPLSIGVRFVLLLVFGLNLVITVAAAIPLWYVALESQSIFLKEIIIAFFCSAVAVDCLAVVLNLFGLERLLSGFDRTVSRFYVMKFDLFFSVAVVMSAYIILR